MSDHSAASVWERILMRLDEKLQMGVLEHARAVVDVELVGDELTLKVATDEAFDFFKAEVNQQRIIIIARPEVRLDSVKVERVQASLANY